MQKGRAPVGVPVTAPELLSVSPAGNPLDAMKTLNGARPPLMGHADEYARPTFALGPGQPSVSATKLRMGPHVTFLACPFEPVMRIVMEPVEDAKAYDPVEQMTPLAQ